MPRTLLVLILMLATAASAEAIPLRSGTATFNQGSRGTVLPIRAGNIENGEGVLQLKRRLTIGRRSNQVVMRALEVDLRPGGVVTAVVDGLRQVVFDVDDSNALVGDNPTRVRIRRVRLLTAGALRGLDRKVLLGVAAQPRFITVAGGQTELTFDATFADALAAAKVTPGANEGAVVTDSGAFSFPVSRGRYYTGRRGRSAIDHGGGLTFSKASAPALRFTDFLLNISDGVLSGRVNESAARVELMVVGIESAVFDSQELRISSSKVTLTTAGAEALNDNVGTAFAEGATVGGLNVSAAFR